jgi:hypothetical protein
MEQEKTQITPKTTNVIDLTKDEEEVVKTCIPITDEIFLPLKGLTQDFLEEKATKENEGDTMEDTHDQGGNTT